MAAALVMTSAAVQAFVYSEDSAREAAAAGHILLAMISVRRIWSTEQGRWYPGG